MYLDEIIVSPKDLMIYDGATDIAFLEQRKDNNCNSTENDLL